MKMFDAGKSRIIRLQYGEKNYDDMLSRFYLILERYGQTDRQTDRFVISISLVSMLTRDKNRLRRSHFVDSCCGLTQKSNRRWIRIIILHTIMTRSSAVAEKLRAPVNIIFYARNHRQKFPNFHFTVYTFVTLYTRSMIGVDSDPNI